MFSKSQKAGPSKPTSLAPFPRPKPAAFIFSEMNKVEPQVPHKIHRAMSAEASEMRRALSADAGPGTSAEQPEAGPSTHRAHKPSKVHKIRESIEMTSMVREVELAGDIDLEEIIERAEAEEDNSYGFTTTSLSISVSRSTDPGCWLYLPICPGGTTVCDWVNALCRNKSIEKKLAWYLDKHPRFTQGYILQNIPLRILEDLYLYKIESEQGLSPELQDVRDLFRIGKSDFMKLIEGFKEESEEFVIDDLLLRLAEDSSESLSGEAFRLFRVYPEEHPNFIEVLTQHADGNHLFWATYTEVETQCMEALRRNSIMCFTRLNDPLDLSEPSNTVFKRHENNMELLHNMIIIPIFGLDGELIYMIEIWRSSPMFKITEVEIAKSFMLWSSFGIMYFVKWMSQRKHNQLNNFLLTSVKAVFEDVISIDQVVKHTLQYAQTLVDADRASLFMLDEDSQELVSRVFDLRGDGRVSQDTDEIRIPIARGIAGHVASTGDTVNIADAYADERFNHEVDEATGYRTTSILCMPVKVDRKVIGVVQMVNKRSADRFSTDDEISFNIFSAFFGLALHNAGVYDIIARNEQKYRVALDVLSYHNTCRENEVLELRKLEPLSHEICLDDFYLDPFKFNPLQKCQAVMVMFNDLFSLKNFDHNSLTRFVLTVKKNYREVPYHNFHHGWSVAQSMYAILKADDVGRFSYKQRLALFVASLCHDLDHRGYTNKYMSETASPLASMYTTSTLEHHHFNITVTILQQDGHNIFDRFSSEEFKDMLGLIKTCILATDLAAFFPNLAQLEVECKGNYDWNNYEHSKLAMALSMTAADLSAAAKPWDIQIETVKVIFEEFYDQGDKERKAGRKPIPMMDRDKPQEQPASQVGFLTSICLPCYDKLKFLLPSTNKMYLMAVTNLEIWQQKATEAEMQKAVEADPALVLEEDLVEVLEADQATTGEDSSLYSNEELYVQQAFEELKNEEDD